MADVRTPLVSDGQTAPEAPPSPTHVAVRREDYRPPDWLVPEIRLDFALDPQRTLVRATLSVQRNGDHERPLKLDGSELKLLAVRVDGVDGKWRLEDPNLLIELPGSQATIETEVEIS